MEYDFAHAMARVAIRAFIDFPFALLVIRIFVWSGWLSFFELPVPTMRQSIGLVLAILILFPSI